MVDEKVISKIQKVLALSKSNYQEEAQAALLKAQELMAHHGLTMDEVKLQSETDNEKQVVDNCISKKRRNTWYEKQLSAIIGDNFRCYPYTRSGYGIFFIGLREDVEIAKEVYLYALATMTHLAREYIKERRGKGQNSNGLKNDHYTGFLNGLKDKFKQQVESKGFALILVKDPLVMQVVNDKKLRKGRKSQYVSDGSIDAWEKGYQSGKDFDEKRKMIH